MNCVPVVIIGAPRSGTNMLRNVLTSLPGLSTWPCDEINYIWRHGHVFHPSDEFTPEMATPKSRRYIRRRFDWAARRYNSRIVVEKTCANSLRVGFVNRVVPEAKYIVIRRHGIDAAVSATKRWKADLDLAYVIRKARFIPGMDLPYYALRYIYNRVRKLTGTEKQLSSWGPIISEMNHIVHNHTLAEVCILQWKRCVDLTDDEFGKINNSDYCEVRYESFVQSPSIELKGIIEFLELEFPGPLLERAIERVSTENVGKGVESVTECQRKKMWELAGNTLRRHGYT